MLWEKLDEKLSSIREFFFSIRREVEYHTEIKIAFVIAALFLAVALIYSLQDWVRSGETEAGSGRKEFSKEKAVVAESIKEGPGVDTTVVVVYITGAVKRPGIYRMKPSSRLYDVVVKAEPLPDAALSFINLAEPLYDGEMIYIPTLSEAQEFGLKREILGKTASDLKNRSYFSDEKRGGSSASKVDINNASESELLSIPGIGPKTAQKIIDYRNRKGRIKDLEELLEIPGIGSKTLEKIKQYVSF
jgi:comEA protein